MIYIKYTYDIYSICFIYNIHMIYIGLRVEGLGEGFLRQSKGRTQAVGYGLNFFLWSPKNSKDFYDNQKP